MTKVVIKPQTVRHFVDLTEVVEYLTHKHSKWISLFFSPQQVDYYKNVPRPNRIYGFELGSNRTDAKLVELSEEIIKNFGNDVGLEVVELPEGATSYLILDIPFREQLITNLNLRPV